MKQYIVKHIRHFTTVFTICLFFWSTYYVYAQTKNDSPLIHSGKVNLLDNEFDQAIVKFSEYLKVFGFSEEAYYWRAHALLQLERIDDAMVDLNLVLQRNPKDSRAMDAMGYAYNQKGNYLNAIKWFNKAIEYDAKNAIIYNNRGMSFYYMEKYSTAFSDFNKAVLLDSTFAQAYSNRGSARYNHQDIKKASEVDLKRAEKDFTIALQKDPKLLSAYRNRGLVRFEMKKYRESFLDFQKAIYLDPTDPLIYYHMGNLMYAKEQYKDAITYYDESLKAKINQVEVLYKRAQTYEILKNYSTARYDYEIIIQQKKDEMGKCYYYIARTYALENDDEHAYFYLNQARKYELFKDMEYKTKVAKEIAFKPYWEQNNFSKLKEKIDKL